MGTDVIYVLHINSLPLLITRFYKPILKFNGFNGFLGGGGKRGLKKWFIKSGFLEE